MVGGSGIFIMKRSVLYVEGKYLPATADEK